MTEGQEKTAMCTTEQTALDRLETITARHDVYGHGRRRAE